MERKKEETNEKEINYIYSNGRYNLINHTLHSKRYCCGYSRTGLAEHRLCFM